jgi:hypothetical protein
MGARCAFAGLRKLGESEPLTAEGVENFLSTDESVTEWNTSFVGFVIEGRQFLQVSVGEMDTTRIPNGVITHIGSGAKFVRVYAEAMMDGRELLLESPFGDYRDQRDTDDPDVAMYHALRLGCYMFEEDVLKGPGTETLRNYLGGAYEVAHLDTSRGEFAKVEAGYVLWHAMHFNGKTTLLPPFFAMATRYSGEDLVLISARQRMLDSSILVDRRVVTAPDLTPSADVDSIDGFLPQLRTHFIFFTDHDIKRKGLIHRVTHQTPSVNYVFTPVANFVHIDEEFRSSVATAIDEMCSNKRQT